MSTLNRVEAPSRVEDVAFGVPSRRVAAMLMAGYVAVVALIVFWPTTEINNASIGGIWVVLHALGAPRWISPGTIEFATNVLLFVPLGFLGRLIWAELDWHGWLGAGLLASATIEIAQSTFLPGRVPSVLDVAANTLGAVLGFVLVTAGAVRVIADVSCWSRRLRR